MSTVPPGGISSPRQSKGTTSLTRPVSRPTTASRKSGTRPNTASRKSGTRPDTASYRPTSSRPSTASGRESCMIGECGNLEEIIQIQVQLSQTFPKKKNSVSPSDNLSVLHV